MDTYAGLGILILYPDCTAMKDSCNSQVIAQSYIYAVSVFVWLGRKGIIQNDVYFKSKLYHCGTNAMLYMASNSELDSHFKTITSYLTK